jgi:hypothetical protein
MPLAVRRIKLAARVRKERTGYYLLKELEEKLPEGSIIYKNKRQERTVLNEHKTKKITLAMAVYFLVGVGFYINGLGRDAQLD